MKKSDSLKALGERFSCALGENRWGVLEELVKELKSAVAAGRLKEAATGLRYALLPDLDYSSAQALLRFYRLLKGQGGGRESQVRIAVLGGYNTSSLAPLIELYLFGAGASSEIYESHYGVFRQEILDPNSRLYSFEPKMVFIATGWRDVSYLPLISDGREEVRERCKRETDDWLRLWKTLHERLGCAIIQNNFDFPTWRVLGNHDSRHPSGLSNYLAHLNLAFQEQAPPYVIIHDVDHMAALKGRLAWSDARFYHYGKLPCASQYLADYAQSVASLIAAQTGRNKKCLVLDLDNTLWGGVIGEDGLEGIRLGQGDPEGEAFASFQKYLKGLRERGIILAACSKNEDSIAREVFEKHPEMVLKLPDFSCFLANWKDKASNLRLIAQQLNIGLDSLVFIDDEAVERALVRRLVPEVAVPEMPDDPAEYILTLEKHRYFQVVALADEDLKRAEYYRSNATRAVAASSVESLEEFLTSLNMKARVAPIEASTLERSAQLINRSNQFNLTTRRYSAAEVRSRMESEEWVTLTVSLTDRFGENGLISALLARVEGGDLHIDTWVMSCRVLKRTIEHFLLNQLCAVARANGLLVIYGEYISTPRNALVCDHYHAMGFEKISTGSNGQMRWIFHLEENRTPLPTFVQKEDKA